MEALTLERVFGLMAEDLLQAGLNRQQMDESSRYYGAYIVPEEGLDHAHATCHLVARSGILLVGHLNGYSLPSPLTPELLLERMDLGLGSLRRFQRPSGCIDLRSANYDSGPDTAFIVQWLCLCASLCRDVTPEEDYTSQWKAVMGTLDDFIRSAVPGIARGGFHTANHRWVVASALSFARSLYSDLDTDLVNDTVAAYLAEGFDTDAEGAFLERSAGGYDAVNTRSLLLLASTWKEDITAEVYRSVEDNLLLNAHLLHADGTIETGLSRRQDYGRRPKNLGLIPAYLEYAAISGDGTFKAVAEFLWDAIDDRESLGELYLIAAALLRHDLDAVASGEVPDDFSRFYSVNKIWRVRRGPVSATVFGEGKENLLTLVNGTATLHRLAISHTYFSKLTGRFQVDDLSVDGNAAHLMSEGTGVLNRPGYEQPLGRPILREEWGAEKANRDVYRLPYARATVDIEELPGPERGFQFHYVSKDILDDVTTQIFFEFPVGGIWETRDTAILPGNKQAVFLKEGPGRMRFGTDCIEIGPGCGEHRIWALRNSDAVEDGYFRVILSLLTPIDFTFTVKALSNVAM